MRYIFLYFLLCCLPVTAIAIPESINICLWKSQIASDLQYGRKYHNDNDVLWHRATVQLLLEQDRQPVWIIRKVLEVFDTVWLQYDTEEDISYVFKDTYSTCIRDYKSANGIYYY